MVLRDYRNIARISYVLIVIALVLFSLSVVLIYSDSAAKWPSNPNNPLILEPNGGSVSLPYNVSINQGDDIFYTASSNNSHANVSLILLEPSGAKIALGNITGTKQISGQFVVAQSGNVSFQLVNHANKSTYVNLTADRISFYTIYTLVFGFATMASGIVLLILASRIKRGERRISQRQRGLD